MKNVFLVLLISILLVSCAKNGSKGQQNLNDWKRTQIISMKIGNKEVPVAYPLDCRRLQNSSKNIHYYYYVVANPDEVQTNTNGGMTETIYPKATLYIEKFTSSTDGSNITIKSLLTTQVDFKFVELADQPSLKLAQINANKFTIARLKYFHPEDAYFNNLKEGDEMIAFMLMSKKQSDTKALNISQRELPGLSPKEELECR